MRKNPSTSQQGFAVLELALIIVALAVIVGIGFWVYQQRSKNITDNSTITQPVNSKESAARSAAATTQKAIEDEAKAAQSDGDNDVSQAQSDTETGAQIGDSSNVVN